MTTFYRALFWGLLAIPVALTVWICHEFAKVPHLFDVPGSFEEMTSP